MDDKVVIQFWGVRGTLPVPGKHAVRYGGNTNCVSLRIGEEHFFIFDAGTGIKVLSDYLVKHNKLPISAKIFITHPHYDHIHGFPFFLPLYNESNEFEIFGIDNFNLNIKTLISNHMDNIYFPITIKAFAAKLKFRSLTEETFYIKDIKIQTILLNHPGRCIGYRVQYKNKIFCYITDNELSLENSPTYNESEVDSLIKFIYEADIVVIDTTYFDDEYPQKVTWGHSCVSRVVDIVDKAKVKTVCLHHHDPNQSDDDIDRKLEIAKSLLKARHSKTKCIAPHEGDEVVI